MTIVTFNEIIRQKKLSLEKTREKIPLNVVKKMAEEAKAGPELLKVLEHNQDLNDLSVIAEYKPVSPSRGLLSSFKVEDVVETYQKAGVAAISVLTEEKFFKSSLENFNAARSVSLTPLIRKDFIMDDYQIYEARCAGASSLLLMVALYPDLESGIDLCHDLGMEPLVECANQEEVKLALESGAIIIGINNRSFRDFSIDLNRTFKLAQHVPEDLILVSESGVNGSRDLQLLAGFGADGVLVGSSIMTSSSIPDLQRSIKCLLESSKGVRMGR